MTVIYRHRYFDVLKLFAETLWVMVFHDIAGKLAPSEAVAVETDEIPALVTRKGEGLAADIVAGGLVIVFFLGS